VKALLLLRHAKAELDAPSGSDFDRRLTDAGRRASAAVGDDLRASAHRVNAIIASPAARVAETVAGVVLAAGWKLETAWNRRLYDASLDTLVEVVRNIDDAVETLLIVAHNPGSQEMILHLADEDPGGLRADIARNFAPAALAELRLRAERWGDVSGGCGSVLRLVQPSDLGRMR